MKTLLLILTLMLGSSAFAESDNCEIHLLGDLSSQTLERELIEKGYRVILNTPYSEAKTKNYANVYDNEGEWMCGMGMSEFDLIIDGIFNSSTGIVVTVKIGNKKYERDRTKHLFGGISEKRKRSHVRKLMKEVPRCN